MQYLLLFTALAVLAPVYIRIATRVRIVDRPNNRSSHVKETVRGGGFLFPVSALGWFIGSGFQFPLFFTGLVLISLVSFWDDLSPISHQSRLIVQLGALSLLLIEIQGHHLPWWAWIPALITAVGILNAYNFMDGINGITAAYSFTVITGLWIVNNYQIRFISNELIYFMMISLAVFSYFNFRKRAVCFAGDVGSISIAYIIVFLLAKLIIESGNWLYGLFLCIYGIDTVSTIIHRLIQKENIFVAHRQHLYQLLANELKIPHLTVAAFYAIGQGWICLAIIVVVGINGGSMGSLIVGAVIIGIVTIVFYLLRFQIGRRIKVLHPGR